MLTVSSNDRVFILAGAGLSAESGIPTFRGVGGLVAELPRRGGRFPHSVAAQSPAGVGVLFHVAGCSKNAIDQLGQVPRSLSGS